MRRALLIAALMVPVLWPAPAVAAGPMVIAGPGSYVATYYTPVVAVQVGGELTLWNAELQPHDVVAFDGGPDTQPWCPAFLVQGQPCPVFWSELVNILTGPGGLTPVLGLENLEPGRAYEFYCSYHRNMTGTLVALP